MDTKSLDKIKLHSKGFSTQFSFGSQSRRAFSTSNLEMYRRYPESLFPLAPLSSPPLLSGLVISRSQDLSRWVRLPCQYCSPCWGCTLCEEWLMNTFHRGLRR